MPVLHSLWGAGSSGGRMPPDFYNMLFSMHATIMIFFVIIPLLTGAFGNFPIPLMIGAGDMAFPKLNMMSYWFMWPAFAIILISFFVPGGAAASGWTSYPTIASITMPAGQGIESPAQAGSGYGQICWLTALTFVGISSMMGSVNYITTIINMRAPGMTLFRMPMTIWSLFITAILQAFALPVLTVALILQLLDKTINTSFFLPPGTLHLGNWRPAPAAARRCSGSTCSGSIRHPAVYIMILPAMGMVSDIIATFSRKPLFGYRPMVYAIAGIACLGFIVWGHHMFQSGMDPRLGTGFCSQPMIIALPSARENLQLARHALGRQHPFHHGRCSTPWPSSSMFVIGGLSGIFMAGHRRSMSTSTTPISSSPTCTTSCS